MECGRKATDGDSTKEVDSSSCKSLASRKNSVCKAFKLLENQGIIVGKTLGSGSYAKVKGAYDVNRKQKVAVKMIIKKKAFEEYLTKFLPREIECMKALKNHYALINSYQIIETTSRYFFVMELAENGDLLTAIKAKSTLLEDEAGPWFVNMYEGLKYMHSKGFVHRDIKCENLVIDNNNVLKITDFGFAKKIGKAKGGGPSLSETYCGSYAYAPPEILKGIPYDPAASDVWSMGVVLFTMLYGRLPFDDSDHKRLLKHIEKKIQFPSKPDVSKKCRILIVKILSKASERIPLKNIMADPWFQEQKVIQKLNAKSDSSEDDVLDDKQATNKDAGNGVGATPLPASLGVACNDNEVGVSQFETDLDVCQDERTTGPALQVKSVESHGTLDGEDGTNVDGDVT